VTNPEFWVRPTDSSVINTKMIKRLPTRRPITSFMKLPMSLLVPSKVIGSKIGRAMVRDFRLFYQLTFLCQEGWIFGSCFASQITRHVLTLAPPLPVPYLLSVAQPRMSQLIIRRPFGELDLGEQAASRKFKRTKRNWRA
jgi:hypothetical protein